jgi:hypothetical protein
MLQYVVILGVIAQTIGCSAYVINTVRGKTKPNRVSWLIWAMAPLIATVAELVQGTTWAALPVFMSGFVPLVIFVVSLFNKKAYWKLGRLDYICGATAIIAIILWLITDEPNIAIIFTIIADGLAVIPTLIKGWKHPETETGLTFLLGGFSATTGLIAAGSLAFAEVAFPIYLLVVDILLAGSIYVGRLVRRRLPATKTSE